MKARWILVVIAGLVVAATWTAAAAAYFFFYPGLAVWTGMVTVAALSLEAFFWLGAGVLGWSFLAGRKQFFLRLRRRIFGA